MNRAVCLVLGVFAFSIVAGCGPSAKPYPLDVCIVTDNLLGSMGDPVSIIHEGQEIIFCCKPCVRKFKANPEKFIDKLRQKTAVPTK